MHAPSCEQQLPRKLHSKRVEKIQNLTRNEWGRWNYTRNECKIYFPSGRAVPRGGGFDLFFKNLENFGETFTVGKNKIRDLKTTLETSGKDVKLHSKRVEKMWILHSKRVKKMWTFSSKIFTSDFSPPSLELSDLGEALSTSDLLHSFGV
jgi:hypothetical protein